MSVPVLHAPEQLAQPFVPFAETKLRGRERLKPCQYER